MANVAVISHPWMGGDALFDQTTVAAMPRLRRYSVLKERLEKLGHRFQTANTLADEQIDVIFCHNLQIETGILIRLLKRHPNALLFYYASEPVSVSPLHRVEALRALPFDHIFTWNDEAVSASSTIEKCNLGFDRIISDSVAHIPLEQKGLLSAIYSYKGAVHADALYQERIKAFKYFSTRSGFDLFGIGWDNAPFQFVKRSYRGRCATKRDVLKRYRFSLAFENARIPGLISEKIFDCFDAGTVPIYLGAPNITSAIPQKAFIDFGAFSSFDALYDYLVGMRAAEYQAYLDAGVEFLQSSAYRAFTSEAYADVIAHAIDRRLKDDAVRLRSVDQFKWQLLKLVLSNPEFPGEFRKFRRMLFDLATVW